jgi:hypothetical protein
MNDTKKPTWLPGWTRRLNASTAISIAALAISASSLYYTRQSELRQFEHLVISEGDDLRISMSSPRLEVTKTFQVTNISERIVSIQSIELDIRRPASSKDMSRGSLQIEGRDIDASDELALIVKPGEALGVTVKLLPSVGPKAAAFLASQKDGDNGAKILALCRQVGIDVYDNPLNDLQRQLCPSFGNYRGKHNRQFLDSGAVDGDVLMLIVRTHRANRFTSDRYKLEIGGSAL